MFLGEVCNVGDMSYSQKMTLISVACGIVAVGLIGWGTVSAIGNTVATGRQKVASVIAARNASMDTSSDVVKSGDKTETKSESSSNSDNKSSADNKNNESKSDDKNVESKSEDNKSSDSNSSESSSQSKSESNSSKGKSNSSSEPSKVKSNQAQVASGDGSRVAVYSVTWSDILSVMASRYNVSIDALVEANGVNDINSVYDGSLIIIPSGVKGFG